MCELVRPVVVESMFSALWRLCAAGKARGWQQRKAVWSRVPREEQWGVISSLVLWSLPSELAGRLQGNKAQRCRVWETVSSQHAGYHTQQILWCWVSLEREYSRASLYSKASNSILGTLIVCHSFSPYTGKTHWSGKLLQLLLRASRRIQKLIATAKPAVRIRTTF